MTHAIATTGLRRALLAAVMAAAGFISAATAQQSPAAAPSARPSADGTTPSPALADARVKRCLFLALRRQDPALDAVTTHVEKSAMLLDVGGLTEAAAECRAALAAFPAEPKVIIAHYNAMEAIHLILFGINSMPDTDATAVAKVRALGADGSLGFLATLIGIYLGTAYEYGVGTPADASEAASWYRKAAEAGDPTATRELARLLAKAR